MFRIRSMTAPLSRLGHIVSVAILAACASAGPEFIPPTRPAEFSLAGIPWDIRPDSVTKLIEPRGYNLNRVDEDGDMWFDGMLFRTPTRIYAFIGDQKLVRFRMLINTPDEASIAMYNQVRAELVKQYGQPKETIEEYGAPYRKGDSKELEALRAGKAVMETYWNPGSQSRVSHVSVTITDDLQVVVDYDGPTWERESVRRRKAGR
jgi:hypothetical protein